MKGLVIRYFMGGFYICDGKPPEGCEHDGEVYLGTTVKWFESWHDARKMLDFIEAAYGYSEETETMTA